MAQYGICPECRQKVQLIYLDPSRRDRLVVGPHYGKNIANPKKAADCAGHGRPPAMKESAHA